MAAAPAGSTRFSAAVVCLFEASRMIGAIGIVTHTALVARHGELRKYSLWEYGTPDPGWILATATVRRPRGPGLRRRLRYWLNSFRGFAAFDVRGEHGRA